MADQRVALVIYNGDQHVFSSTVTIQAHGDDGDITLSLPWPILHKPILYHVHVSNRFGRFAEVDHAA